MLNYLKPEIIIEVICFIIASLCLLKANPRIWQYQIAYLCVVCTVELTGVYLKRHHQGNQWIYNILLLFEILFICLMFRYLFSRYIRGRAIIICGLTILIILYIYELSVHGFLIYNNITYTIMSVVYILYALFYYYLLLKDESYIDLKFSCEFWWVTGILFFYFGSTAANLFHGRLSGIKITSKHFLPYYIFIVLNYLIYGCWSYSFICKKWLTKTSRA